MSQSSTIRLKIVSTAPTGEQCPSPAPSHLTAVSGVECCGSAVLLAVDPDVDKGASAAVHDECLDQESGGGNDAEESGNQEHSRDTKPSDPETSRDAADCAGEPDRRE